MIKNIIFDIGDVLVYFKPDKAMEKIGIEPSRIQGLMDSTVNSKWWCELDRGVMKEVDVIAAMIKDSPDYEEEIIKFFKESAELLVGKFDYTDDLIRLIKSKGYGVYLLSNYPVNYFEIHMKNQLDFASDVDGKIVSGYVKLIKPDEKIYRLLLEQYNLNAEECLFIDDKEANIEAAIKVGINGVVFKGYDELLEELKKMGII